MVTFNNMEIDCTRRDRGGPLTYTNGDGRRQWTRDSIDNFDACIHSEEIDIHCSVHVTDME